jgi:NADH-quinone oxidoreductase subunit E/NADP-reducing hydrogenase subunit HndA
MPKVKLSEHATNTIKEVCKSFDYNKHELINVLHQVQNKLGYLPAEVQELIAKELNMSAAKVYGVVTFYSKIEVGETTADGLFSLNALRCVGACGLAPVVLVGDKVHGRVAPTEVKNILAEYKEGCLTT